MKSETHYYQINVWSVNDELNSFSISDLEHAQEFVRNSNQIEYVEVTATRLVDFEINRIDRRPKRFHPEEFLRFDETVLKDLVVGK